MHDDVRLGEQRVDSRAVEDVASAVLGLGPAVLDRVKWAPRHGEHALDLVVALERPHEGLTDLAGGPGDRNRQCHERKPNSSTGSGAALTWVGGAAFTCAIGCSQAAANSPRAQARRRLGLVDTGSVTRNEGLLAIVRVAPGTGRSTV